MTADDSTVLDRVTGAILGVDIGEYVSEIQARRLAWAAIEAMSKPDRAMLKAAMKISDECGDTISSNVWAMLATGYCAMIDAALVESEPDQS